MSFQCQAIVNGENCANKEASDHTYLGFLVLCVEHQFALEESHRDNRFANEMASVLMERAFGHIFKDWKPVPEKTLTERRESATVYFMRCGSFYKIGYSEHPTYRLDQIRKADGTRAPDGLDLSATQLISTEPGGFPRERELHRKFAHLRHTGEWFIEAPELTEYIDSLKEAPDASNAA